MGMKHVQAGAAWELVQQAMLLIFSLPYSR